MPVQSLFSCTGSNRIFDDEASNLEGNTLQVIEAMAYNNAEPIVLNSTDETAVSSLVTSIIQSGGTEYTVLNEHQEDITDEIKKLVSLMRRMKKG